MVKSVAEWATVARERMNALDGMNVSKIDAQAIEKLRDTDSAIIEGLKQVHAELKFLNETLVRLEKRMGTAPEDLCPRCEQRPRAVGDYVCEDCH